MGLKSTSETRARVLHHESLFHVTDPLVGHPYRGSCEASLDEHPLLRGDEIPREPVLIRHAMGKREPGDIVWTTGSVVAVSQRVIDLLDGYSGWSSYPVRVFAKSGEERPGYHGLTVTGRCGPYDPSKGVRTTRFPAGVGWAFYKGVYFDLDTWDGTDVFLMGESLYMVVTERVKDVIEDAKIRNIGFVPLREAEFVLQTK